MKIKLHLYGIAREIVGSRSLDLDLQNGDQVHHLLKELKERYPRLKDLSRIMIAVNDEYAENSQTLTDKDEVVVVPPVSGG